MKFNSEEFLRLVSENQDLEIMPMVATECVCDDGYAWWSASLGAPKVDEYYIDDERIYLKSQDIEELVEQFVDNNYDDNPYNQMTSEELEAEAKRVVGAYEWTKAIMLPVNPR